jgi:hypothetical protein
MKKLTVLVLALAICPALVAAGPDQAVFAGVGWNQFAAPQVNGVMAYAKKLFEGDHPTYSYTAVYIQSIRKNPFQVGTSTETGAAQHITRFGPFDVYGLGTLGLTTSGTGDGTTSGFSYSGGGLAQAGIGKGVTIGPMLRFMDSTITEKQWALWVVIGWGK